VGSFHCESKTSFSASFYTEAGCAVHPWASLNNVSTSGCHQIGNLPLFVKMNCTGCKCSHLIRYDNVCLGHVVLVTLSCSFLFLQTDAVSPTAVPVLTQYDGSSCLGAYRATGSVMNDQCVIDANQRSSFRVRCINSRDWEMQQFERSLKCAGTPSLLLWGSEFCYSGSDFSVHIDCSAGQLCCCAPLFQRSHLLSVSSVCYPCEASTALYPEPKCVTDQDCKTAESVDYCRTNCSWWSACGLTPRTCTTCGSRVCIGNEVID